MQSTSMGSAWRSNYLGSMLWVVTAAEAALGVALALLGEVTVGALILLLAASNHLFFMGLGTYEVAEGRAVKKRWWKEAGEVDVGTPGLVVVVKRSGGRESAGTPPRFTLVDIIFTQAGKEALRFEAVTLDKARELSAALQKLGVAVREE